LGLPLDLKRTYDVEVEASTEESTQEGEILDYPAVKAAREEEVARALQETLAKVAKDCSTWSRPLVMLQPSLIDFGAAEGRCEAQVRLIKKKSD